MTDRANSGPKFSRRTALALPLGLAGLSAQPHPAAASESVRGGTMMIVNPEPSTSAHYKVSAGNIPQIATQVCEGLVWL